MKRTGGATCSFIVSDVRQSSGSMTTNRRKGCQSRHENVNNNVFRAMWQHRVSAKQIYLNPIGLQVEDT